MSRRTVSWNTIDRAGHNSRPKIPAGLLSARAQVQGFARFQRRPLVVAGKFDRSAIMTAAAIAATGLQERYGLTRTAALSTALKAAWQAAKMARTAAAH
ncbi:hypothetical protein [Methylobacterium pseudosasicola]|uniref:Uncharacterized protein n=1 Tax=Methylobacterium pseudosasicola TaxID=582667 RepID=A0A1I4SAK9_9HYPH|nr:hypothetical protein [Methylobacterium pseudosasicola]SFM61556.1 hypothetical protein SAMN05192568_104122 [Methylobacterium pseudosasicola]